MTKARAFSPQERALIVQIEASIRHSVERHRAIPAQIVLDRTVPNGSRESETWYLLGLAEFREYASDLILRRGAPMTALEVLATMLRARKALCSINQTYRVAWSFAQSKQQFVNINGFGYWPARSPLPANFLRAVTTRLIGIGSDDLFV